MFSEDLYWGKVSPPKEKLCPVKNRKKRNDLFKKITPRNRHHLKSPYTSKGKLRLELHFEREPRKEIHNILGSTKKDIDWLRTNSVSDNAEIA